MSIPGAEKKLACGLCGIFLGWLGVHRFLLGDTTGGLIRIGISIVTCTFGGQIIGIIEGIMMLTKTDQQFVDEYIVGKKAWF